MRKSLVEIRAEIAKLNAEAERLCEGLTEEVGVASATGEAVDSGKHGASEPDDAVKMNLISFFAVMTGHQRRHLAQAEKIRAEIKS